MDKEVVDVPMVDDRIEQIIASSKILCDEEEVKKAESILREALDKFQRNDDLRTELARVLIMLDKDSQAESILLSVLKNNPQHENATSYLGRLLDTTLRVEEAENLYRSFLQAVPDSHRIVSDFCHLLVDEERFEEAIQIAEAHRNQFPLTPAAVIPLREVLIYRENHLECDLDDNPGDSDCFHALLENLVSQLEVFDELMKLKEITEDDEEEKLRIVYEIQHLQTIADRYNISIDEELQKKLQYSG